MAKSNRLSSQEKKFWKAIQNQEPATRRQRLEEECAKLDPNAEKALAEEGMSLEIDSWPEY